MKLKRLVAIGAATFVVLTALIYWLQGARQLAQPKKAYTHLHCPDCQFETAYSGALDGKFCPQCGTGGARMVPTVGPHIGATASHETGPVGRMMVAGFLSLLATLALVYGLTLRSRTQQQMEVEAQNRKLVCRCPFCGRRIGYSANIHGAAVVCPRCKTAFTPTEGEELDDARTPHPG